MFHLLLKSADVGTKIYGEPTHFPQIRFFYKIDKLEKFIYDRPVNLDLVTDFAFQI